MHEHIALPHYPNVGLTFTYRGVTIEITTSLHHQRVVYSAWVTYATGSAVAVPKALTRKEAITRAKRWVRHHFS